MIFFFFSFNIHLMCKIKENNNRPVAMQCNRNTNWSNLIETGRRRDNELFKRISLGNKNQTKRFCFIDPDILLVSHDHQDFILGSFFPPRLQFHRKRNNIISKREYISFNIFSFRMRFLYILKNQHHHPPSQSDLFILNL